jgi:hypothetical protein
MSSLGLSLLQLHRQTSKRFPSIYTYAKHDYDNVAEALGLFTCGCEDRKTILFISKLLFQLGKEGSILTKRAYTMNEPSQYTDLLLDMGSRRRNANGGAHLSCLTSPWQRRSRASWII